MAVPICMHARIILVWGQVLCRRPPCVRLKLSYRMSLCEATQQSFSNFSCTEAAMALMQVPDLQLMTRS